MKNVLEYLEISEKRDPNKIAVLDDITKLSYKNLLKYSKSIGTALSTIIEKGDPVGVYIEKSANVILSFFGVVYAGGFYSVLNNELPDARLEQIVNVLEPKVILTTKELIDRAEELFTDIEILVLEDIQNYPADEERLEVIRGEMIDTDPLYVNFTSGSTGVPKGIVVAHRSVIDFIDCFTKLFEITDDDVIANQAPFDFDVSVKDIYSSIKTGATLLVIPRRLFSTPSDLMDYLCDNKATTMIWAVSAICLLTTFHTFDYRTPDKVNKVIYSGEVLPYKALKAIKSALPKAKIVNVYGPTEITCNCTYHILQDDRDYSEGVPIGKAFPNERVFLLNDRNEKVIAENEIGEICVAGTTLALGYYKNEEQNREHFVQNPLNSCYRETIYKTGDLAKYNDNHELVFCGRKDFQIKYLGHRIELEEVEKEMSAQNGVDRCCCIFDEKKSRLKGFYVGNVEPNDLFVQMSSNLPAYMVPGILRKIDEMPLTKNGKIDRRILAEKR